MRKSEIFLSKNIGDNIAAEPKKRWLPAMQFTFLMTYALRLCLRHSRRLIYFHDTAAFFEKHYGEIEELRQDCADSGGEPLSRR